MYVNVSKSGLSFSAGVRGASVTFGGKGGTYVNAGIPGSGIYTRQKINDGFNDVIAIRVKAFPECVEALKKAKVGCLIFELIFDSLNKVTFIDYLDRNYYYFQLV